MTLRIDWNLEDFVFFLPNTFLYTSGSIIFVLTLCSMGRIVCIRSIDKTGQKKCHKTHIEYGVCNELADNVMLWQHYNYDYRFLKTFRWTDFVFRMLLSLVLSSVCTITIYFISFLYKKISLHDVSITIYGNFVFIIFYMQ